MSEIKDKIVKDPELSKRCEALDKGGMEGIAEHVREAVFGEDKSETGAQLEQDGRELPDEALSQVAAGHMRPRPDSSFI